jgi:hypothetical protein
MYAGVNDCTVSNWDHTYTGDTRKFRVNYTTAGILDGVSSTEFRRAAIGGAELWNEYGNHGSFS